MRYANIRGRIGNGDLLLVKNRSPIGWLIRALTGESWNHAAMFVWMNGGKGLWVGEMREAEGFRLTPASQWMQENAGKVVMWGRAPRAVHMNPDTVRKMVLDTRARNPAYSYRTLIRVWWSQIRNRKVSGRLVCSTWVQSIWESCGVEFSRLADPGDLQEHARDMNIIRP